jgi:hypothetical protein
LWFEEFEIGSTYPPGRTITETNNVLFTTLTTNTQPVHLDLVDQMRAPSPPSVSTVLSCTAARSRTGGRPLGGWP